MNATTTRFAQGTERLVDPTNVGAIHFLQRFNEKLPTGVQRKMMTSASRKVSKMGFVVEPYAFFLFYEIPDVLRLAPLLPDGFRPCEASVFAGDGSAHYAIASVFRLHTSAFWGARAEFYAIAENVRTGLLSWVILDYVSDTLSYDSAHGLRSPEARGAVVTTTCDGLLVADIAHAADGRRLACSARLGAAASRQLDERLWVEGNTSIAYGRQLSGEGGDLFSLTFLPEEMHSAWEIPLEDVQVEELSWFPQAFSGRCAKAACFPYAQHMLSDSPGMQTHYASADELRHAALSVDFASLPVFSVGARKG